MILPCTEKTFTTFDGTELFYRAWTQPAPPDAAHPDAAPRPEATLGSACTGAIIMLHRGHEHSGRMEHIAQELGMQDFAFFAWDARGHGRSPGERGDSPSFAASVRDVDCFVQHICTTYGFAPEQVVVLAQSVGAVLAATWAHDYAPPIRALVLASPAFSVKLYVPFARQAIKAKEKFMGNFFVNSYVKAKLLTHDQERIRSFENDPLVTRAISARMLTGLYENGERVVEDAAAITLPTLLLVSGADWVVRQEPQHAFFNRLPCPENERHILPGFFHDTLGEKDREQAFARIRAFVQRIFAMPPYVPNLRRADKEGPSATAAKWLQTPLPALSAKGLGFALARLGMRTAGQWSEGIRLGLETGFDSGSTLDYVYRNNVGGSNAVGRFFDAQYLNSPGWTGIRARKMLVEELMLLASQRLASQNTPVRVLDIAAGHGRYILDALQAMPEWEHATLRDYSPLNVVAGSKAIAERGLSHKAVFVEGDAFSTQSLAGVEPKPTLAVVSGLYELFPANHLLEASLAGLAQAVASGGYLVYTNQPWHPQLEFIARVLTSHRQGDAWVMRCRSQPEMDQLVRNAGFEKITQRIDPQGIFSVGLARRV